MNWSILEDQPVIWTETEYVRNADGSAMRMHGKTIPIVTTHSLPFCKICRGISNTCMICHAASKMREHFPELVEHCRFIHTTWRKMKRFQMLTTGDDSVDRECYRIFGSWETLPEDQFLLSVVARIHTLFYCNSNRALKLVDKHYKLILAARYKELNLTINRLSMKAGIEAREGSEELKKTYLPKHKGKR